MRVRLTPIWAALGSIAATPALAEGGLPQLRQIDTFASQVFWLVVTFAFLYFVMSRIVLPRIQEVMEEREDKVADDLARADRLAAEADGVEGELAAALDEARGEASKQLKEASDALSAELAKQEKAFNEEMAKRSKEAEGKINAAKEEANANLKTVASDVAAAVTEKLLGDAPAQKAVDSAVSSAIERNG